MTVMNYLAGQHVPSNNFGTGFDRREWSNNFLVRANGYLTGLAWYRDAVGVTRGPAHLRLWRADTQEVVWEAPVIPDDGAVGWQWARPATAVALLTGITYKVSGGMATGVPWSYWTSFVGTAPYPFTRPTTSQEAHTTDSVYGYPDANDTQDRFFGFDIEWSDEPPPTPTEDVSLLLTQWLSSSGSEQTHETDGIPWLLKTELAATKIIVDGLLDLTKSADGVPRSSGDWFKAMTGPIIAAAAEFFPKSTTQLVGPDTAGGSAFYTSDARLVSNLVAEIWQRVRTLRNDLAFGVAPWAMTAEEDFEDAIAFAQPADAYVVSITSYQDTQPATESPAGLWLPRLGWWCVLTGDLASQRQFVDFERMLLSDGGRRMAGAAIQLRPGTTATVQSWVLA